MAKFNSSVKWHSCTIEDIDTSKILTPHQNHFEYSAEPRYNPPKNRVDEMFPVFRKSELGATFYFVWYTFVGKNVILITNDKIMYGSQKFASLDKFQEITFQKACQHIKLTHFQ